MLSITADANFVLAMILVTTRLGATLAMTSVLGFATLPRNIALLFVLSIAAVITLAMPSIPDVASGIASITQLLFAVAAELLMGAAMGFGILVVFGAFSFGGRLIDNQVGFGIATFFDPSNKTLGPLLGTVLTMVAAALFLSMDAHHTLLRGLQFSFDAVPLGHGPSREALPLVVAQFGFLLLHGMVLVAPAAVGLLLADVAVAIAARLQPQMNAYFVSLPAKAFLGLVLMAISLKASAPYIADMYRGIFAYWSSLFLA